jgi:GNAT superfamily N-acetyltransferase
VHHGSVHIHRATAHDSHAIADVLTLGFQRGGWLETVFQPLWHFSLYDDLRHRLTTSAIPYACWLARYEVTDGHPEPCAEPYAENRAIEPDRPLTQSTQSTQFRRSPQSHPNSTPIATVELSVRPSDTWNRDPWFWQTWPWGRFGQLEHLGQRNPPHYPYIANLAVIASARRLGIASRLLERCERTARAWGYDRLYLHVLHDNTPARSLYQQQGYRIQAETSSPSLMGWNQPRQILLCKRL